MKRLPTGGFFLVISYIGITKYKLGLSMPSP